MIPAHDSPLAALAFDATGTKLATASEKVRQPVAPKDARWKVSADSCILPTQSGYQGAPAQSDCLLAGAKL